uniref:Uncharacterized protein n=1 Tax=Siphoviridae sp. ctnMR5 TaxID=2825658 RepID=A0A8S5U8S2_9CAUD|nr:MAG TPA: hypothetical protein [Siphoviridae sp. ctnMR5]
MDIINESERLKRVITPVIEKIANKATESALRMYKATVVALPNNGTVSIKFVNDTTTLSLPYNSGLSLAVGAVVWVAVLYNDMRNAIVWGDSTLNVTNLTNTVQTVPQTLTTEQKEQVRANIGALSSADLSVWAQRTLGEEDLNTLADAGYQKAYISRYRADTTNTPTTYGNIISFRSSAGDLTQLALAVTTNKMYYRQSSSFNQYGTWQEVLLGLLEKGDNFSLSLSNGLRLQVITDTSGVSVVAGQVTNKNYTYPIAYSTIGRVVGITTNESGITTSIASGNSDSSTTIYFRNNTTNNITINRVNIFIIGY